MPLTLLTCPYDSSHKILRHRLSKHLCKCRKQYPGTDFSICPFNATHNVLTPELKFHCETCPDRKELDSFLYVVGEEKSREVKVPNVDPSSSSENWDEGNGNAVSYLVMKEEIVSRSPVIREAVGKSKSERKKFMKDEVQRIRKIQEEAAETLSKVKGDPGKKNPQTSTSGVTDAVKKSSIFPRLGLGRGKKLLDKIHAPKNLSDDEDEDEDEDTDASMAIVLKNKGQGRAVSSYFK